MDVFPIIFEPILKQRIWGGRRLADQLGKSLPDDEAYGESWEVADLEEDQSMVRGGPVAGRTMGALVRDWGKELLGRAELIDGRFPLLIKFLDANESLSVQVHPDEAMAKRLGGDVRVKHEAWYILHADEKGCIYRGLREGVTQESFRRAIEEGSAAEMLNRIPVKRGQCFYLPSGTVHALGAGVLVAEVQTPSDITYRVYDWDRVDASTGQPRELHIDHAMECIDFSHAPIQGEQRSHVVSVWTAVTQLVKCPSFVIEQVRMAEGVEQPIPYAELVVWMVIEGRGSVRCRGLEEPLSFKVGDTVVLPAGLKDGHLKAESDLVWLEVTLPVRGESGSVPKLGADALREVTQPRYINIGNLGGVSNEGEDA
jgi:mannose-6-phosphate isomerase